MSAAPAGSLAMRSTAGSPPGRSQCRRLLGSPAEVGVQRQARLLRRHGNGWGRARTRAIATPFWTPTAMGRTSSTRRASPRLEATKGIPDKEEVPGSSPGSPTGRIREFPAFAQWSGIWSAGGSLRFGCSKGPYGATNCQQLLPAASPRALLGVGVRTGPMLTAQLLDQSWSSGNSWRRASLEPPVRLRHESQLLCSRVSGT
jgi:hypothetical protein